MKYARKEKNTILVVDNDPHTYKILKLFLSDDDFDVIECTDGKKALGLCLSVKPDIVLLDLPLAGISAQDMIVSLREWSQLPVIILSGDQTNEDVVDGLNMGADDYVIKPFNADVLRARINASLRKSFIQETGKPELVNGPLRMNLVRHEVFLDDRLIPFTPKEYGLLRYMMIHCGKMLGHRQILQEVWGKAHGGDTQYLRVFIGQIRDKIEKDSANPTMIKTELGIGYRMEFLALREK